MTIDYDIICWFNGHLLKDAVSNSDHALNEQQTTKDIDGKVAA
jgi:hypothetical protein